MDIDLGEEGALRFVLRHPQEVTVRAQGASLAVHGAAVDAAIAEKLAVNLGQEGPSLRLLHVEPRIRRRIPGRSPEREALGRPVGPVPRIGVHAIDGDGLLQVHDEPRLPVVEPDGAVHIVEVLGPVPVVQPGKKDPFRTGPGVGGCEAPGLHEVHFHAVASLLVRIVIRDGRSHDQRVVALFPVHGRPALGRRQLEAGIRHPEIDLLPSREVVIERRRRLEGVVHVFRNGHGQDFDGGILGQPETPRTHGQGNRVLEEIAEPVGLVPFGPVAVRAEPGHIVALDEAGLDADHVALALEVHPLECAVEDAPLPPADETGPRLDGEPGLRSPGLEDAFRVRVRRGQQVDPLEVASGQGYGLPLARDGVLLPVIAASRPEGDPLAHDARGQHLSGHGSAVAEIPVVPIRVTADHVGVDVEAHGLAGRTGKRRRWGCELHGEGFETEGGQACHQAVPLHPGLT